MTKIVVDHDIREKLLGLKQPLEICDEDGRVLGHFVPDRSKEPILPRHEIERRLAEPTFSTEEVIKYLESL